MKNKKLTYVLGIAVAVVWGLIIYRIVGSLGSDNETSAGTPIAIKKELYNDYAIPKDTTRLTLNYRDPFGLVKFKDTTKVKVHVGSSHLLVASLPAINWSFIRYSGYIRNPVSKKLIALLQINGKSENMAEGETINKVKLLKNMQDSVKISFNGKIKFITIQHG